MEQANVTLQKNKLLIEAFRIGDERILLNCYKNIKPRLYKYVIQNSGTADEAEELIWECLEKFRQKCLNIQFDLHVPFARYMYGIYRYTWLDKLKKRQDKNLKINFPPVIDNSHETHLIEHFLNISSPIDMEYDSKMKDLLEWVTKAIQSLSQKCQRIFMLSSFKEQSHKEIGEQLDIKPNASRKRLKDCRDKLKELMRDNNIFQDFNDEEMVMKFIRT